MGAIQSPFGGSGLKPWQFSVAAYGAKGDGKVITDAAMTSGQTALNSPSQAQFTAADQGKSVLMSASAGAYVPQSGTITAVPSATKATVSFTASATTGGTPGAIAYYGTDDTAAIQNCLNAAVTYAKTHNGFAQVVFDDLIYVIGAPFTIGGATAGNAQITLPVIDGSAQQVVLELTGARDAAPLMHWLQLVPQASGTVIASTRTDGTNDGTNGPASVIGGPVAGYGGEPGTFSNALVRVSGIGMLVPYNATQCGLDLFGMVEADIRAFSCMTAAVVPTSSAPVPSLATPGNITNQYTFGLRMPDSGNQTVCHVDRYSTEGMCYGFCPSEWTYANYVHVMYAIIAIAPWAGGVTMVHAGQVNDAQCENCTNALGMNGTGTARLDLLNLQTESISASALIFDPSSQIQGTVHLRAQGSAGNYTSNGFLSGGSGGALLRIINEMTTPGPVSSPHAAPSSANPWFNGYMRDAWITLSATTITAVTITGLNGVTVTQNGLAGSPATYTLFLPSAASFTPTYTGTLTLTVTLI